MHKTEGIKHKINIYLKFIEMKIDTARPNDSIIVHEWH